MGGGEGLAEGKLAERDREERLKRRDIAGRGDSSSGERERENERVPRTISLALLLSAVVYVSLMYSCGAFYQILLWCTDSLARRPGRRQVGRRRRGKRT